MFCESQSQWQSGVYDSSCDNICSFCRINGVSTSSSVLLSCATPEKVGNSIGKFSGWSLGRPGLCEMQNFSEVLADFHVPIHLSGYLMRDLKQETGGLMEC